MGYENIPTRRKFGNIPVHAEINGKQYNFRCKIEYRWAQHLEFLRLAGEIKSWEYETHKFIFEKARVKSFLVDFVIRNNDDTFEYHETKGMLGKYDIDKLQAVFDEYPDTKITLIFPVSPRISTRKRTKIERYCHRVIYNARPILKKEPIDMS
jgi:hypothetical protein